MVADSFPKSESMESSGGPTCSLSPVRLRLRCAKTYFLYVSVCLPSTDSRQIYQVYITWCMYNQYSTCVTPQHTPQHSSMHCVYLCVGRSLRQGSLWCGYGVETHRGGAETERSDRPWVALNLCILRPYNLRGNGTWYDLHTRVSSFVGGKTKGPLSSCVKRPTYVKKKTKTKL